MKTLRLILPILLISMLKATNVFGLSNLVIDNDFTNKTIAKYVEIFEDKSRNLDINDIADIHREWKRNTEEIISVGYTASNVWFRFSVNNTSKKDEERYLQIYNQYLDHIRLFVPNINGTFEIMKNGDGYPAAQRVVDDRIPTFLINPKPGISTYYLCINSGDPLLFDLFLMTGKEYFEKTKQELPFFVAYYAIILVMIIYNLFIFFFVRDLTYLYFVIFLTCLSITDLALTGIGFQYLWPNSTIWGNVVVWPFSAGFTFFWLTLYIVKYLDIKKKSSNTYKLLLYFVQVPNLLVATIYAFVCWIAQHQIIFSLQNYCVMIGIPIYIYSGFYMSFFKKSRQARIALSAFLVLGLLAFIPLLTGIGAISQGFIATRGIQIGVLTSVVILSIGLADKMNIMKNELKDLNINLEEKVLIRTEELQEAIGELSIMNDELVETRDSLWGEMQLAKKIQTVLLPEKPKIKGYGISTFMKPADEVGGDYYDIVNIEGSDWIIVGDVSGHGVPAGLVMMMVQTSVRSTLQVAEKRKLDLNPSELLTLVNATISRNIRRLGEDKYMTITAIATSENGKFVFSGLHQDIMIYRAQKDDVELVPTHGMWIGIVDDIGAMLENHDVRLDSNDVALLYTDGITEASKEGFSEEDRNSVNDMFGDKSLLEVFKNHGTGTPEEIKVSILNALSQGGYVNDDDITMVVIKRNSTTETADC
ncbi:MAG: SpoIIE family protein phosphatase [Proteobacteria bacterium]|nr:SpoIIE family protein phosphatase [Pseudomonadota bacterium]